jgi:hypothetical protein
MMPNPRVANGQWTEAVGPIAAKLEVGATFGERTVFNREGSKALAELLREMARIIDNEIEHRKVSE